MNWQELVATALIALNVISFGHSNGIRALRMRRIATRKIRGGTILILPHA